MRLWDLYSGFEVKRLTGHRNVVEDVAFSPNGALLASASSDDTIRLWDAETGQWLRTLTGHTDCVYELAFNPDGQRLISASRDSTLRLWDVRSGREIWVQRGDETHVMAVDFSPDGRQVASAGYRDHTVKLWDAQSGRQIKTLTGHQGAVLALAFSPDGRNLVSGGSDRTVKIWDVSTGRERRSLGNQYSVVVSLVISPDGRFVTVGLADNTSRIWDARNGQPVRTLFGHTGTVSDLAYTPDGRWLASASGDGSIRLWNPHNGRELAILSTMRGSEDWLVVTREGLFDGSDAGTRELVAWRIGNSVYPLDRFYSDFYTPSLLARLFAGERPQPDVNLAALQLPPQVRLSVTATGQRAMVIVKATDQGVGIREVRLYQNGKLISARAGERGVGVAPVYEFPVELVSGENQLTAVAVSEDGVESNEDTLRLSYEAANVSKPSLHLLAIGINRYEDRSLNLGFARPDAEAIARFFQGKGHQLFRSVNIETLIDEQAKRENIQQALERLADKARPEDIVIVYLAGHGVSSGQQFYFLTQGMRGETNDAAMRSRYGLPANLLGDFLRRTPALKQLLILDTCYSGSALPILGKLAMARGPGAAEKRAIKMLARANGVHLIAAATEQQYAYEVPSLGHGVLTYALLSGLGESGPAEAPSMSDGLLTVYALLQYVNQVVPELTQKHHKGSKQYPVTFSTGMDFPLAIR